MAVQPIGAAFRTRRDRHRPKLRAGPTSNIRTGADNAVTLQPSVSVRLRNLTSWTIVSVRSENQLLTRKASEPADHFIDYGGHAGNNGSISISPGFRSLGEHGLARQSTL